VGNKPGAVNLRSVEVCFIFSSTVPFPGREGGWETVSSDAFRCLRSASLVASQQPELPAAGRDVVLCMGGSLLRRAKLPLSVPSQELSLHRTAVHSNWAGPSEVDDSSCGI